MKVLQPQTLNLKLLNNKNAKAIPKSKIIPKIISSTNPVDEANSIAYPSI
jgi:hypothetical protein